MGLIRGLISDIQKRLQGWGYAQASGQLGHTGSWGTPELGVTEFLKGSFYIPPAPQKETLRISSTQPAPQVLGSSTRQLTGGGGGSSPTNGGGGGGNGEPIGGQPSGPSPEEIYRQQIESAYGELSSQLDRMAGLLPGMEEKWKQTIANAYTTLTGGVESELQSSLNRLQGYREQVGERQATTLRDLATNLRNMLMAGNIYLGARGAGASSAQPMYAYALSKLSSRQRADVLRQANEQFNEINMKEEDVRQTATQELNNIKIWKEEKMGEIAQWFDQQRMQIESQRAQSIQWKNEMKLAALQNAIDWLRQLDSQAISYQQAVQDWATQRLAQLNDYKIQLGQLSSFSPRELVWQELPGIGTTGTTAGLSYAGWNPWAKAREEEKNRIASIWG